MVEHKIVTLPPGEHVITIDTPPAMRRSSPFGTFQSVDAFDKGLEGKLVLTPIEEWMTPAQREDRLRSHHTRGFRSSPCTRPIPGIMSMD